LILGRFFRNSFLPLALFVATSRKKIEIQPYHTAVDSFFSNFLFLHERRGGRPSFKGIIVVNCHNYEAGEGSGLRKFGSCFVTGKLDPNFGLAKKQTKNPKK
jgi:hypothetical protein